MHPFFMRISLRNGIVLSLFVLASLLVVACGGPKGAHSTVTIEANTPDLQKATQTALLNLKAGDTLSFGEGTFDFTGTLSLDTVPGVVIRGAGKDKTILNFKNQKSGAEGLLIKAGNFTIRDLTIRDTKGDGIKVQDVDGVTFQRLHVTWSNADDSTAGAYGIYPVQSRNVLIEDCEVTNCMDAGIYLGQSTGSIVRRNKVHKNVCGIEIENSSDVEVYENEAFDNAGGILVFDLPKLIKPAGGHIRVYNNIVRSNNHRNFSPKGVIAAEVPAGTGIMIMSVRQVEVFNNRIEDHNTVATSVISYKLLETSNPAYSERAKDTKYNPFPAAVHIYNNTYTPATGKPDPNVYFGVMMAKIFQGRSVPSIVVDGILDPSTLADPDQRICIRENKGADFACLNAGTTRRPTFDAKPFDCTLPPLTESKIPQVTDPAPAPAPTASAGH